MDKKRYIVKVDATIDPPQYQVVDTVDLAVVIGYADVNRAENICKNFNDFNEKVDKHD